MGHHTSSVTLILLMLAAPAGAQELRLTSQNDIVAHSPTPDDLYTFSEEFAVQRPGFRVSLRENAFTDRAAGIRFDETYLSLGRPLHVPGPWAVDAEVGIVHVGHGLFGQDAQNAVHRVLGCDPIHLRYVDGGVHPRLALAARRPAAFGRTLTFGPRIDVDAVPGLRSWALVAAEAVWHPAAGFTVEALAGDRITRASYAPLVQHLAADAPAANRGFVLARHVSVSWSYNDFGDKREHVTAGYRLPVGRSARARRRGGEPVTFNPD